MRQALRGALVAAAIGAAAPVAGADVHPVWTEAKWPFPIDQWGTGKAFHCAAAECGTDVDLFLRAKIGFCNCATGVADDAELERVADLDLFGDQRTATADGRGIAVRWMKGRSRAFAFPAAPVPARPVLAIAFNDRCDVIVASVVAANGRPAALEAVVLAFLNSEPILHWAEAALGL
jgi:hypothetical protein